ncbi:MAG TPA: FAD-dependent oxidoreductase [Thermoanaerobaculia bacterium]|jgi:thioredoxin reductase|nr:FAD-dependent oxidoreductase [Thermoanaerobaculia bacterium]
MSDAKPRIAILGSGPTGLEAALAAADAGFPFTLYEAAPTVAGNVRAWGHVRLFTPWEMNVSPRMRQHLEAAGREVPGGPEYPTGRELAGKLFEPLASLSEIAPDVRLGTRVLSVGRQGLLKHEEIATAERGRRPFRILLSDETGREWTETADVVIDATGTWGNPNTLGDGGIPAPGERSFAEEIRRDIPDFSLEAADWAGKTVLLAGAGHSAQTAVRALAELPETRVVWILRNPEPSWGTHAGDPLPERARLAAEAAALAGGASPAVEVRRGVAVEEVAKPNGRFEVVLRNGSGSERIEVDRILSLTGAVGDHGLYRQLQVHECYATCGPIKLSAALLGAGSSDCLAQTTHGAETLTNPEPGFFILGSKSYGRNNSFLMRIGWEQVGEVFGLLTSPA